MAERNQQTWIRIKRIEIKEFASAIGNEAMVGVPSWPATGEGRAVKAASERLIKTIDVSSVGGFSRTIRDFEVCRDIIESLSRNSYYIEFVSSKLFRDRHSSSHVISEYAIYLSKEISEFLKENTISLVSAANISKETVERIARVLPEQKFGPLYYTFQDGKLSIEKKREYPVSGDSRSVDEARNHLIIDGRELSNILNAGNCDYRLVDYIITITNGIEINDGVISLGLQLITLDEYIKISEGELPSILIARLRGFLFGTTHFIGQFRDWELFIETSSKSNFDADDIESTQKVGRALVHGLQASNLPVSKEVPQSIERILEAVIGTRESAKRAAWAALRAIENLVIAVAKECVASVKSLKKGADKGLEKGATAIAMATLLYVAVSAAGDIAPHAARIMKASWISDIIKIVNSK